MILSKKERTIIANLIEEKFGPDAVKLVDVKEYGKIKEYFDSLEEDEKQVRQYKPEEINEFLAVIYAKDNEITRDKECSRCGKQEVFFGGKDMFYIIKHNVCEKCYIKYGQ